MPERETEMMPSRDSRTAVRKRRSSVVAAEPRPPAGFSQSRRQWPRPATRAGVKRLLTLLLAAVVLYGVAPAVLEVLGVYKRLTDVDPGWWIAVVATSAAGIWCMCALQRLVLQRPPWFPTVTSQLAGTAFSKVVPGGAAAAAASPIAATSPWSFAICAASPPSPKPRSPRK